MHGKQIFCVLQRISAMLDCVREEWCGGSQPLDNGLLPIDSTTEFYRLWSGLQFVCCLPTGENELSNHELFGDGLMWAGCSIIHFLGQQHRFEVFDFAYHILNVEESAAVPCTQPAIQQFFKKVGQIRDINQSVFNTLRAYSSPPSSDIVSLHPPTTDTSDQFISNVGEASGNVTIRGNVPSSMRARGASLVSRDDVPPPPPSRDLPPPPRDTDQLEAPPPPDFLDQAPPPPPMYDDSDMDGLDSPPPPPPR